MTSSTVGERAAASLTAESLRERSKARRRDAIERAAARLFAERGYEETTVQEVAELAEVSPRTVSLYFPTKVDLAIGHVDEGAERLITALERMGEDADLFEVFGRFLQDEAARCDPELRELRAAMFARNPQLKALGTVKTEQALALGTRALARALRRPEDDAAVMVTKSAALGVMRDFPEVMAATDPETARTTALTFLSAGMRALGDATPADSR